MSDFLPAFWEQCSKVRCSISITRIICKHLLPVLLFEYFTEADYFAQVPGEDLFCCLSSPSVLWPSSLTTVFLCLIKCPNHSLFTYFSLHRTPPLVSSKYGKEQIISLFHIPHPFLCMQKIFNCPPLSHNVRFPSPVFLSMHLLFSYSLSFLALKYMPLPYTYI